MARDLDNAKFRNNFKTNGLQNLYFNTHNFKTNILKTERRQLAVDVFSSRRYSRSQMNGIIII